MESHNTSPQHQTSYLYQKNPTLLNSTIFCKFFFFWNAFLSWLPMKCYSCLGYNLIILAVKLLQTLQTIKMSLCSHSFHTSSSCISLLWHLGWTTIFVIYFTSHYTLRSLKPGTLWQNRKEANNASERQRCREKPKIYATPMYQARQITTIYLRWLLFPSKKASLKYDFTIFGKFIRGRYKKFIGSPIKW